MVGTKEIKRAGEPRVKKQLVSSEQQRPEEQPESIASGRQEQIKPGRRSYSLLSGTGCALIYGALIPGLALPNHWDQYLFVRALILEKVF